MSLDANKVLQAKFSDMADLILKPLERPILFRFNPDLMIKIMEQLQST